MIYKKWLYSTAVFKLAADIRIDLDQSLELFDRWLPFLISCGLLAVHTCSHFCYIWQITKYCFQQTGSNWSLVYLYITFRSVCLSICLSSTAVLRFHPINYGRCGAWEISSVGVGTNYIFKVVLSMGGTLDAKIVAAHNVQYKYW